MGIVSVDIEKLLDCVRSQDKGILDLYELFKPVFGNILSYDSAVAIHENTRELNNLIYHGFKFYEDRMFIILYNNYNTHTIIFEVDTNKDNYKNLKPYKFNYLKLGKNHKCTGILEHDGYLLGYHYDGFDGENGLTAYISYILFKDNIICTEEKECIYHCIYNGAYNSIRKLTDLDDLPSSFDKKEWQEIFESIFILYNIK